MKITSVELFRFEIFMAEFSKGNPFFVLETLKLLEENESIIYENGLWTNKDVDFKSEVPNRVEDIFFRRLSSLDDESREILQVAAVIGYKFDPYIISQILEIKNIILLKKELQ